MKCPNCGVEMRFRLACQHVYQREVHPTGESDLEASLGSCPACGKPMLRLRRGDSIDIDGIVELEAVRIGWLESYT